VCAHSVKRRISVKNGLGKQCVKLAFCRTELCFSCVQLLQPHMQIWRVAGISLLGHFAHFVIYFVYAVRLSKCGS